MWQSQNHKQYPMYIAKNLPFKNIFDKGVDCPFLGNTFIGYGPKLLMPLRSDKGGIINNDVSYAIAPHWLRPNINAGISNLQMRTGGDVFFLFHLNFTGHKD